MESSVTSLLRILGKKEHLFTWLLFLLFLFYKAGREILPWPSKSIVRFISWNLLLWCYCSSSTNYCHLKMIDCWWGTGGTWYAPWKSDTLPSELFRKNVLNEGERWCLFSLEVSRVREGFSCCLPPGRSWREDGARLFSEEQLERTGPTGTSCSKGNFDFMSGKTAFSAEVVTNWNWVLARLWDTCLWRYSKLGKALSYGLMFIIIFPF